MLSSEEYATIKADYEKISRAHFPKSYFHPEDMSFARSDAIFPPTDLAVLIGPEYEQQCRTLSYGPFPFWDEVQGVFSELRDVL